MRSIIFILLLTGFASGQNMLVKFYPDNQPYVGLTNYPAQVQPCEPKIVAKDGWTNMSAKVYADHVAALMPVYSVGESNSVEQSKSAYAAKISSVLDRIDALREWEDRASTNSLTANQQDKAIKDICIVLRRLKPALKQSVEQNPE